MAQRASIAYAREAQAIADAQTRGNCRVIRDQLSTFHSVPLERQSEWGIWTRGAHVERDQANAHGIARPVPYDWAGDIEMNGGAL